MLNQPKPKGRPQPPRQRGGPPPGAPPAPLAAHAAKFAGSWIGQTMGYEDSPAHIWEIKPNGRALIIESRWENEERTARLSGLMLSDEDAFVIGGKKAVLIDPQHFWVEGWDTNDVRGKAGPDFDVVFSRPGLAELSAAAAYQKIRKSPQS